MENATKALLIAAAVLVVILIISLGVGIFRQASETVDGAGDLSEYELQQHNDKFEKHLGDNRTGSEVNAMLKTVFNYNMAQDDDDSKVLVRGQATLTTGSSEPADKVPTGTKYDVTARYENGLVKEITVSEAK